MRNCLVVCGACNQGNRVLNAVFTCPQVSHVTSFRLPTLTFYNVYVYGGKIIFGLLLMKKFILQSTCFLERFSRDKKIS